MQVVIRILHVKGLPFDFKKKNVYVELFRKRKILWKTQTSVLVDADGIANFRNPLIPETTLCEVNPESGCM